MSYTGSRNVMKLTITETEKRRRIRRRTVTGACIGGLFGAPAPFLAAATFEIGWLFDHLGTAGVAAVALSGAVGVWLGATAGRTEGVRDAALGRGETTLSQYDVRPPVVDGRPTRPSDVGRFHLRMTDRNLQFWEGTDLLWSHPWSEVRLSTVKGNLLLVHHGDREIAELLPVPETMGWDTLLLGAQRLRARSRGL
ncbi:hypothetical protein ABT034_26555 [Streptomyces sp. NPDC002773]|uniref:hypothetical protein n=1 Tax=Streptomyces sp. NPDC002773 TaxID=3154430 RepID=UPI0033310E56